MGQKKGYKFSEEHKRHLSEAAKNRLDGHNKSISEGMKKVWENRSEEKVCKIMDGMWKAKKEIWENKSNEEKLEYARIRSEGMRGKNAGPKDGVAYKSRNDPKYDIFLNIIWRRDRNCRSCNITKKEVFLKYPESKAGYLLVHHPIDWDEFPELRFDPKNGILLCYTCHKDEHRRIRAGKPKFPYPII
jgi:hypothetical protein